MRRDLGSGLELDDDAGRVDVDAVHRFLAEQSYWARGRSRATVRRLVREAARVVGVYAGDVQVGFARVVSDGVAVAYLADVYVEPEHRGRGVGVELVREAVEGSPLRNVGWFLHTRDAHALYGRFGFGAPSARVLERPRR